METRGHGGPLIFRHPPTNFLLIVTIHVYNCVNNYIQYVIYITLYVYISILIVFRMWRISSTRPIPSLEMVIFGWCFLNFDVTHWGYNTEIGGRAWTLLVAGSHQGIVKGMNWFQAVPSELAVYLRTFLISWGSLAIDLYHIYIS